MRQWDDDEALVSDDRRFTYAEFRRGVLDMARALWRHGIRPGQTVGIYAYNPPESLFMQLGAHLIGVRTAWVAPTAPLRFRNDFIRLAGIDAFVYEVDTDNFGAEMAKVAAPLPIL